MGRHSASATANSTAPVKAPPAPAGTPRHGRHAAPVAEQPKPVEPPPPPPPPQPPAPQPLAPTSTPTAPLPPTAPLKAIIEVLAWSLFAAGVVWGVIAASGRGTRAAATWALGLAGLVLTALAVLAAVHRRRGQDGEGQH